MAGSKRTFSGKQKTMDSTTALSSPYMPMFETFRNELDSHHDRRERVIKASRDITALSKKMIFSLQRTRQLKAPVPAAVAKENGGRYKTIAQLFTDIAPELQGINAWRYQRQISSGVQEYIEAISFQHYLETQRLVSYSEAELKVPQGVMLTEDDYVLGLFDLVGELMRFAITAMATSGEIPGADGEGQDMVRDMRSLRAYFEGLDLRGSGLERDAEKKMDVMKTSVEKVENAVYGLIVRGKERPKGWILDEGPPEPVESY